MRKTLQMFFVLAGIILVLTACDQLFFATSLLHSSGNAGSQTTPADAEATAAMTIADFESLLASLRASGAEVAIGGSITQPFFNVEGQTIAVNGADVQVFVYPTEAEATAAASEISPDGGSTATTMITWMASPHFYQADNLIVLYVGDDDSITSLLTSVLGEQFAAR
jgi:hypothetical protein